MNYIEEKNFREKLKQNLNNLDSNRIYKLWNKKTNSLVCNIDKNGLIEICNCMNISDLKNYNILLNVQFCNKYKINT